MNIYRLNRGATTFLTSTVKAFAIISSIIFCYAGVGSTTLASDETQFHIKWATAVVEAVENDCSPNELWEMASGIAADHQDESRANVFICFGDLLNAKASKFVGPFVDRHEFKAWVDLNVRLNSKGDGEEKTLRLVKKLTKGESLPEEAYFFLAAVILDQENVCAWQRLSTCELPTSRETCGRRSLSQETEQCIAMVLAFVPPRE